LACEPQRCYRREELIELLWPDYELDSGRNCFRIALASLRQQLEPDLPDKGRFILADRTEVSLNPEAYRTDKAAFEAGLKAAAQAQDDASQITALEQAVDLYRSELLPNFDDVWVTEERQRLADAYLLALRRLIKAHVRAHRYEEALELAQR